MSIAVQCEECFQSYKVKEERAGQTLKCKSCGSKMRVPAVEEELEDLSADYGEPIAQPRKKKAGTSKPKKKKTSTRKSLRHCQKNFWCAGDGIRNLDSGGSFLRALCW